MNPDEWFLEVTGAYADGVRALFAQPGLAAGERGGRGPVSYGALATQAEALLPLSGQAIDAAQARLDGALPLTRADTEAALLAKALVDLDLSSYLFQAARDEERQRPWSAPGAVERGVAPARDVEPALAVLLGSAWPALAPDRAAAAPASLEDARLALLECSNQALDLIARRATTTTQTALEGLLGIGLGQLAAAVGLVGTQIGAALGQAEKLDRLYALFRGFLFSAYDTLVALLGPQLARQAAEELATWAEKLELGQPVGRLMEALYGTQGTRAALKPEIEGSQADLVRFALAIEQVGGLNEAYRRQSHLADQILPKLKWVAVIPAAALPQGRLLLAAAYLVLAGYVVFLGADYVDARRLRLLDRVPGVRRTVQAHLVAVPGG